MKSLALIAAGLLMVPASAFADEAPTAPQATATAEAKLICKKETESGSLVRKKRVCRTRAEWDRLSQTSQNALGEGQMSGSSSGQ